VVSDQFTVFFVISQQFPESKAALFMSLCKSESVGHIIIGQEGHLAGFALVVSLAMQSMLNRIRVIAMAIVISELLPGKLSCFERFSEVSDNRSEVSLAEFLCW
jgi:hypothetical protein